MDGYTTGVDRFADAHTPGSPLTCCCSATLVHHYRVHKRGLPHIAFRRNYMSQLCALLPLSAVLPTVGASPNSPSSNSMCPAGSPDAVVASPRTSRRAIRRQRPVWVMESPMQNAQVLMVQDPLAAAGAVVLDCRPHYCQFRWTPMVWTCRRFGLQQCQPWPRSWVGGFTEFDLPGAGRYSTGRPGNRCGG